MPAEDLPLVSETDLKALLDRQEDRFLEFKVDWPSNAGSTIEAVCAFANTLGGDLIIGIDAPSGVATEVVGVRDVDPDATVRQWDQKIACAFEPPLKGHVVSHIALASGNTCFAIRIPASFSAPHRIKSSKKFMSRTSAGKNEMDILEIRDAFVRSVSAREKAREFHLQRVQAQRLAVYGDENYQRLFIHLLPIQSFVTPPRFTIDNLRAVRPHFPHIDWSGRQNEAINLDGLLLTDSDNNSRVQIFRNGCVEVFYRAHLIRSGSNKKTFPLLNFEYEVMDKMPVWIGGLKTMGMDVPIAIFTTLVDMSKGTITLALNRAEAVATRDDFELPDALLADMDQSIITTMKYTFDVLWNAFGDSGSPSFKIAGEFSSPP